MSEYYMFHKPSGCITANRDDKYPVVMDYFRSLQNPRLMPVGRLDFDTEGLLFVTDDGKWGNRLMSPEHHVPKKYFFWAYGELTEEAMDRIRNGVPLKGRKEKTLPAQIEKQKVGVYKDLPAYAARGKRYEMLRRNPNNDVITAGYITITEGKKRQVKRMLKAVVCYFIYLKRLAIGDVWLDERLKPGEYRKLTEEEMNSYNKL